MPKTQPENQLTDAERYDLAQVLAVYPPGPLSDADRHMAERFGFSHTTLRCLINGRPASARTLSRVRAVLPTLLSEYSEAIATERRLEKSWSECSEKEKALRTAAGLSEEQAARLNEFARLIFPSKFSTNVS